jgi:CheY-like chemotaxis protein
VVAEPTNGQTQPTEHEHHDQQFYLLLVDDHATNRLVTSATIKQDLPNAHIDQARNGAEAIEKMKVNRYDLVLMDMVMPDYSGTEVTRIIRNECQPPFSNVKVVALTASVAETLSKECADVGISEILRKPFERNKLIRTILKNALS